MTDTGVGIAPEDQEAVFEEFRQVGTADKKVEGTGLGLALSRKFIELHGGRIWVKSQVGQGSTFTFTLPVRREPSEPPTLGSAELDQRGRVEEPGAARGSRAGGCRVIRDEGYRRVGDEDPGDGVGSWAWTTTLRRINMPATFHHSATRGDISPHEAR